MEGLVASYSGATMVINVDTVGGSGTFAAWNINLAGIPGAANQTPWVSSINASGYSLTGCASITALSGHGTINLSGYPGVQTAIVAFLRSAQSGFPATSGSVAQNVLLRLDDDSNAVLDMGGDGGSGFWLQVTDQTTYAAHYPLMLNPNGGNVGVGTTAPSYQLQLSTDSAAKPSTSTWTVASDHRLKQNVEDMAEDSTAILAMLRWVRYQYNGLGGMPRGAAGIGLVAQEVQPHIPEAVRSAKGKLDPTDTEDTEILNLDYHAILVHCARAIAEIDERLKKAGI
jgi:hypothetical protein